MQRGVRARQASGGSASPPVGPLVSGNRQRRLGGVVEVAEAATRRPYLCERLGHPWEPRPRPSKLGQIASLPADRADSSRRDTARSELREGLPRPAWPPRAARAAGGPRAPHPPPCCSPGLGAGEGGAAGQGPKRAPGIPERLRRVLDSMGISPWKE